MRKNDGKRGLGPCTVCGQPTSHAKCGRCRRDRPAPHGDKYAGVTTETDQQEEA